MLAVQTFHVVSCLFRGEFGTVMTIHQLSVEMVGPMLQFPLSSLRHPQSFSETGKDRGVVRIGRYVVSRTASTLILKFGNNIAQGVQLHILGLDPNGGIK